MPLIHQPLNWTAPHLCAKRRRRRRRVMKLWWWWWGWGGFSLNTLSPDRINYSDVSICQRVPVARLWDQDLPPNGGEQGTNGRNEGERSEEKVRRKNRGGLTHKGKERLNVEKGGRRRKGGRIRRNGRNPSGFQTPISLASSVHLPLIPLLHLFNLPALCIFSLHLPLTSHPL